MFSVFLCHYLLFT